MKPSFCVAAALSLGLLSAPAMAQTEFPARLAGHAILPALTLVPAPAGAPADLHVSGKFTTAQRADAIGSIEGRSAGRPTGIQVPFRGPRLLAVDSVNATREHLQARKLLDAGVSPTPEQAADPAFDLGSLLPTS